ncbi:MAG TPA: hypothetical protein VFN28_07280 [Amaricoccus sp.]|nr:hypothetical protein [Amaricoccus sp.]
MRPDSHEIYGRRRSRNRGLGLVLLGFVLLTFAVTVVKLSEGEDMRGFDHTPETLPQATAPAATPGQDG